MSAPKLRISYTDIICRMCKEVYRNSRVLSCGDTFCYQCLKSFVESGLSTNDKSSCPVCKKRTTQLELLSVDSLPRNLSVAKIVSAAAKSQAKTKTKNDSQLQSEQNDLCKRHKGQILSFVCRSCNEIVCAMCKLSTHSTHTCVAINLARRELVSIIKSDLFDLNRQFSKATKEIRMMENRLEFKLSQLNKRYEQMSVLKEILEKNTNLKDKADIVSFLRDVLVYLKATASRSSDKDGYCFKHKDQQMSFFCRSCNDLVCAMCNLTSHSNHSCVGIDIGRRESINTLKSELVRCRRRVAQINKELTQMESMLDYKQSQLDKQEREIDCLRDTLEENKTLDGKTEIVAFVKKNAYLYKKNS